jgi:hypothetical protein
VPILFAAHHAHIEPQENDAPRTQAMCEADGSGPAAAVPRDEIATPGGQSVTVIVITAVKFDAGATPLAHQLTQAHVLATSCYGHLSSQKDLPVPIPPFNITKPNARCPRGHLI